MLIRFDYNYGSELDSKAMITSQYCDGTRKPL